jgi:mRNA-degrading endonuclease toxin of MazEF toxin-antitoxin module
MLRAVEKEFSIDRYWILYVHDCAVLSDQVKSLDWKLRKAKKKAVVPAAVMLHIRAKMKALLMIS